MTKTIVLKRFGTFYGRGWDGLICTDFIKYIGLGYPKFITIKSSTNRIHSKGCLKIENRGLSHPYVNGEMLPYESEMSWHYDLLQFIEEKGFGKVFYICITTGKA